MHLPRESVATIVEDAALSMLLQLFDLSEGEGEGKGGVLGRTFTTGATGSNILGLACGREFGIGWHLARAGVVYDPGMGMVESCISNFDDEAAFEFGEGGECGGDWEEGGG